METYDKQTFLGEFQSSLINYVLNECVENTHTHTYTHWKKSTREPAHTVGGNINWYNHHAEEYGSSLKTQNTTTISPTVPLLGIQLEKT